MSTRRRSRTNPLRRTRRGGALLGAGAQGTVYDLNGADSFLSSLPAGLPTSVTLHTNPISAPSSLSVEVTERPLLEELFALLRRLPNVIAKRFKASSAVHGIFLDEVRSNCEILRVYGDSAPHYLTMFPIDGFADHRIVGAIFHYKTQSIHVTFGKKCTAGRYPMNLPKLLTDLLESLVILQTKEYEHNDIKLDNIVLCGDTYKLIDWGEAAPLPGSVGSDLTLLRVGTPITTSPIRWYCKRIYKFSTFVPPIDMMGWRMYLRYNEFYKSAMFQEQYARIRREYEEVLREESDRANLYGAYGTSFALFQLGMTALHAVVRYRLDYAAYKPIIEYLTSLRTPAEDARVALTFVRSRIAAGLR